MNIWFLVAAFTVGLVVGYLVHRALTTLGSARLASEGRLYYKDEAGRWFPRDPTTYWAGVIAHREAERNRKVQ